MKKLCLPSLVALVRGTNRSPLLAERRPGWPELSHRLHYDNIGKSSPGSFNECNLWAK